MSALSWPRAAVFAGVVSFVALGLAGCGQKQDVAGPGASAVRVDGSSTVFPISEAVAEGLSNAVHGRVQATVGESGSGGGFRKFCRGETDISDASRPISTEEMAACAEAGIRYVEVPVAYDGLTVVVHPSNPLHEVTIAELRSIWAPAAEGKVMNWRQVNQAWPDQPLLLFGAGTASGTFDFFTEAVVGEAKASRTDYTPSEDDNVTVQGVASNPGAMGYFGLAYYEQNQERLHALAISKDGAAAVAPNAETVASGAYPLARPLFIYINAASLERPAVAQFVQYYLDHVAEIAPSVGYVRLPDAALAAYRERVQNRETGTAFGGQQQIGVDMADILSRPLVHQAE